MDLVIENVEKLTLNFPAGGTKPTLAEALQGMGFAVKRAALCDCADCTARRAAAAPGVPATASSPIPCLGQAWPGQGGINAGLMRGEAGQSDYYLILAEAAAGGIAEIAWAGSSCDSSETEAKSKADGLANTKLLAESALDFPAAQWARSVTIEGHSDFYLPSQRELALCWATVPEAFEKGYHWSSTQYSRGNAWYQYFVDGYQDGTNKSAQLRARAVRRFIP